MRVESCPPTEKKCGSSGSVTAVAWTPAEDAGGGDGESDGEGDGVDEGGELDDAGDGDPGVTVTGPEQQTKSDLPTVNAPLTGVFYRSPTPQAAPFVQIGAIVNKGDVIALIEAMKLFNEIRSTAGGKVSRIFAENGQLVRAHQPLLELEPI